MKIGVISDTHQNMAYLNQAIEVLQREKIELLIHLGDDYRDIAEEVKGIKVIKVPGVYDPEYQITSIPHRQVIELGVVKAVATHSVKSHENDFPDDVAPDELARRSGAKLVLYGHTHLPLIEEKEGLVWMNPGHLKGDDKKGAPASYGLIEVTGSQVVTKIIDLIKQTEISTYTISV